MANFALLNIIHNAPLFLLGLFRIRIMKYVIWIWILLTSLCMSAQAQTTSVRSPQKRLLGIEVHFRFDKSQFDVNYMDNAQALERFAQAVDSIGLDRIDSVVVVSQSSPEGAYKHNLNLSHNRAATMHRVVLQRHPELEKHLHVRPDGESWEGLRTYVANDKKMKRRTIDQVLRIIDSDVNIDTKKWRLQQLPIYRYLLQTHYPRLRNSVFCIVYYSELPPVEEPVAQFELPHGQIDIAQPLQPVQLQEVVYREPMLNVHTNLLYDLGTALNFGIEYYPHDSRWSVAANYTFPWWGGDKKHRYMQLIDGELQVRRYFDKKANHAGHYLAAYVHANYYDFSFDAERAWQGEGNGIGLSYGYVWRPWKDKRWKLEAFVRLGYYHSLYDPYHASDPYNGKYYYDWDGAIEDFERRNYRLRWFGPTGLGITLSYDLLQRKIKY